jgi:hypothetical protein
MDDRRIYLPLEERFFALRAQNDAVGIRRKDENFSFELWQLFG